MVNMCVSSVTSEIYMYTFACFIQILLFLFIKLFLNTYIMKLFIYLVYYTINFFLEMVTSVQYLICYQKTTRAVFHNQELCNLCLTCTLTSDIQILGKQLKRPRIKNRRKVDCSIVCF